MGFLYPYFPRFDASVALARRTLRQYWVNGSARAWARLLRRPFLALGPVRPPVFIDIAPTYRCQCRCVHCAAVAQAGEGEEMTTAEIKALIGEAASMGVLQVIFSGGEPLLREDIADLIRHAHDLGMLVRLNTNGLLLTRERVRELKQAGVALVGISLDRPRPEDHDRVRGVPGLYDKAIEGVRNLQEAGMLVQLQVYVSKETAGQTIREIIAKARELRVFCALLFFAIASGRWDSAFDELLTEEEEADVQGLQREGFVNVEFATPHTPCCGLIGNLAYVSATGNMTICPFVSYSCGNVRKEGLATVWRRRSAVVNPLYRGRCPMNTLEDREVLKRHAASIAARQD
jgi:MoaA/NifB/PqqE/SkfB family radical SAM enzyme